MSKALQARLARIEAVLARRSDAFDCRAAFGIDREKFAQAMRLILGARTHMARVYSDDALLGMRMDWKPAPYEPQPPADWTDAERAAWPSLVELYDSLDTSV